MEIDAEQNSTIAKRFCRSNNLCMTIVKLWEVLPIRSTIILINIVKNNC